MKHFWLTIFWNLKTEEIFFTSSDSNNTYLMESFCVDISQQTEKYL